MSCHLTWLGFVPGNLSAPGTIRLPSPPVLLWFGWYHLVSPHSSIVLVQVTFLSASISCLALWTKEPRVSSGTDVHCAMDLVPVFPGATLLSFCSLPKAPAGAGSRWKQAAVGYILYQRYWNSFMQMSNHFHLKSWENKCLQTAAL